MNPIKLMRLMKRANTLGNLLERGSMNKSLWKSKTFWFQVLSAAAALSGVIPMPPATVAVVTAVINVGLRLITSEPVAVVGDPK
jgi:hypothetical protein